MAKQPPQQPTGSTGPKFSLDKGGPSLVRADGGKATLGGAGGFSLDAKPKVKPSPITAPMPKRNGALPGSPLSIEGEESQELKDLQEQFQDDKLSAAEFQLKKAREEARKEVALDATYWCGLVFATTEDANQFLAQLGVPVEGQFLDGYAVAERLGFPITRTPLDYPMVNVLDMWEDIALDVPEPPPPPFPDTYDPTFE